MPTEKQMVMIRADFDAATSYGSYWLGQAEKLLTDLGTLITDLYAILATKSEFFVELQRVDPLLVWGMGHGNETQFAGQDNYLILEKDIDESLMIGRVVHLTSCLTGVSGGLLESLFKAGALTCFGYAVEFIVGVDTPNFTTTPDNNATKSLMKPDLEIEYSLAKGMKAIDAFMASDEVSNSEIEFWRQSNHPDADLLIFCLINNRDGKVLYGEPQVTSRIKAASLSTFNVAVIWVSLFGVGIGATQLVKEGVS